MSDLNISNFIWNIADDVLRDVYVRGKYRDVILPMTVIRRLDAVLEPTKDAVLAMKAQLDKAGVGNQHAALCQASGESEQSKIFPNAAFGYWKVTVERPLRLKVELSTSAQRRFAKTCTEAAEEPLIDVVEAVAERLGEGPHLDFNRFLEEAEAVAGKRGVRMTAKRQKLLMAGLGTKDPGAKPVIKKVSKIKPGADPESDALYGNYHRTVGGKPAIVEYEPDTELRDTEQVPFLEDGGIEAFFRREVLPHASDAWIDPSKTVIGYEISFTRHFYKPQPLRALQEIEADIRALEQETEGLLEDVLTGGR